MTIIKKFDTDEVVRSKFPKRWVILAGLFLLALALIEVWVNNTTVAFGEKFEKMKTLEGQLNIANQILSNEIAKTSSLLTVSSKSAELGFQKPKSIQYIK